MANYLDQGLASWHSDAREEGFYAVWRRTAAESWISVRRARNWGTPPTRLPLSAVAA